MGISVIGADSEGNNFSVDVGASGNNVVLFDREYAAGAYSITSQLADSTLDIYAVNADGALAGYTSTKALSCSKGFSKLVIYGATTNDVLAFEFKTTFAPTQSGTLDSGAAPFLTSATPATLASVDDTTTVTGGNFASNVEIVFTGQDAVDRAAKSIVRSSSTSLIVTRPDVFPVAQEPFSMTATNPGIPNPSVVVNKLTDFFDAGSGIIWVTTSPLPIATKNVAYSTTLEATDADGTSVVYSLTAGTLPTGLSLNGSTGVISGTPTANEAQTVTVTATDAGANSSTREFTLGVVELTAEYLVIAGGGSGGNGAGGGGGAGGYRSSIAGELSGSGVSIEAAADIALATNYTVTVGAGGTGQPTVDQPGSKGANSIFGTIVSEGGGRGAGFSGPGGSGGSGGGASHNTTGGTGTVNQGTNGAGGSSIGGGGGGAGVAASASNGGNGLSSSVTGSTIARAGGGGGFSGTGGAGGGAAGATVSGAVGLAGAANTGSGGGGTQTALSGAGGSGVVILRYSGILNIIVGAGLSSYTLTDGTNKVTVFTAGSDNVSFEIATAEVTPVEFLIVAGGGGSGSAPADGNQVSGGGGAGGYVSDGMPLAFADGEVVLVTVGAGGTGVTSAIGGNGTNSLVKGLIAVGGGSGAAFVSAASGGSGGGAGPESNNVPGRGTYLQGFNGAFTGYSTGGPGGGGAAEPGNTDGVGHGGDGRVSTIITTAVATTTAVGQVLGEDVYFAGGGAGAPSGVPGLGGGGAVNGGSGLANTGGAGSGNRGSRLGGSGGSGVVILKYPATKTLSVGAGLTSSTVTIGANKITVLKSGTGTVSLS